MEPKIKVHPMCQAMSRTQLKYVTLSHDGINAVLSTSQVPQPTPRPFSVETGVLHHHEVTCSCKRTLPRGSQGCSCNPFKLAPTQDPPTISFGTDYPKYDLGNTMLSISKPAENITQLPNCRKCGGEPMLRTHDNRFIRWSWVECTGCPCRTNVAGSDFQAIQEWKRGDVICDKSVAGESPGISPEPEQAESAITALHVGKEYSINGVPCYLHSMTPDGTPKTENAYTTMPDFICLFVPCGAPTTPSAAVGASEPVAGGIDLAAAAMHETQWLPGSRCPRCGAQLLTDGERKWCSFVGGENRGVHIKGCRYGLDEPVKFDVPSDSKPTTVHNPESEDTPPHNQVMGPVVGTAKVTFHDQSKTVPPEAGKRYMCRNGEVTKPMRYKGSKRYPYTTEVGPEDVLRTWTETGKHDLYREGPLPYDLIAEYHEPDPSPPAESPDDWVMITDPKHVLRSCDEVRYAEGSWHPCRASVGATRGTQTWEEFRCRRKDLPVVPIKAPVTKLPSSVDVNRPENTKTRTVTLREYEEIGAHTAWSTSVSEYSFTGRTAVVEVPE